MIEGISHIRANHKRAPLAILRAPFNLTEHTRVESAVVCFRARRMSSAQINLCFVALGLCTVCKGHLIEEQGS